MNNPDVTEKLNAPATSTPASGSVALTAADRDALSRLPDGWFDLQQVPWQVRNPRYRCDRLAEMGALRSRVVGEYPNIKSQWAKPLNESSSAT